MQARHTGALAARLLATAANPGPAQHRTVLEAAREWSCSNAEVVRADARITDPAAGINIAERERLPEAGVTVVDGILAVAVLVGLALNAITGWWWADPAAAFVLVLYAVREVRATFQGS